MIIFESQLMDYFMDTPPEEDGDTAVRINDEMFEEMRDLLAEDFNELVQEYMDANIVAIEDLRDAFAHNDNREGFEVAHKVKGASANLGINRLMELCAQMQNACRQDNIHSTAKLIKQIENEIQVANAQITARLNPVTINTKAS